MTAPALSVVVPLFNEAATLPELVARCVRAAELACPEGWELLLVDDGSTDATEAVFAGLERPEPVSLLRLDANQGQFRALQHGLRQARGELVCLLDGDLQDPPELFAELVAALGAADADVAAAFAVKSRRHDPLAFRLAQGAFHRLQAALSKGSLPLGASSYCLLRAEAARQVAAVRWRHGNVAAVVAALGQRSVIVPYVKAARADAASRIGLAGHIGEGVAALAMTGALGRLLRIGAAGAGLGALAAWLIGSPAGWGLAAAVFACLALAALADRRRAALVRELQAGARARGRSTR